jgi:hypothetical protein
MHVAKRRVERARLVGAGAAQRAARIRGKPIDDVDELAALCQRRPRIRVRDGEPGDALLEAEIGDAAAALVRGDEVEVRRGAVLA